MGTFRQWQSPKQRWSRASNGPNPAQLFAVGIDPSTVLPHRRQGRAKACTRESAGADAYATSLRQAAKWSVLSATQRIVGRVTASAIAEASAASVLPRLTQACAGAGSGAASGCAGLKSRAGYREPGIEGAVALSIPIIQPFGAALVPAGTDRALDIGFPQDLQRRPSDGSPLGTATDRDRSSVPRTRAGRPDRTVRSGP